MKWGELSYGDEVPRPEPGAGAGLKTGAHPKGSDVFVVDIDGEEALAAWLALPANAGKAREDVLRETYTVETGRGWQLYHSHPGFRVRNSASELTKGVDIRGDGGFVVVAGSPHKSGKAYRVVHDVDPTPAPDWLLTWLREQTEKQPFVETQGYSGDVTDPEERRYRRELYTKYLREDAPPRGPERRGKGDQTLFDVVQRGAYDLELSTDDVLECIREHYDPRCSPQWGPELEERVRHKARDAKTKSTRPRAEPVPRDLAHLVLEMPPVPPPAPRKRDNEGRDDDGFFWDSWDEPILPPRYLVGGLVPVGTVGMLVAMGSSLKTWTMLSMGAAIARGTPWLGKYQTEQGRVLVADYESGLYELRRRMHLLEGRARVPDFGAWAGPDLRIDQVEFWEKCARVKGLRLLCIDSLAAGAPGVDENDPRVATPMYLASKFTDETGAAVLFIHHSKKDDSGDPRKIVRGNTALYNACDWAYKFDAIDETHEHRRMQMVCIKPGPGPLPFPVPLELTDEGLALFQATEDKPRADAPEDEIQRAILLALSNRAIESKDKIARAISVRPEKVRPEVDALMVRREIAFVKGMGYVLDSPSARQKRICALVESYEYWKSEAAIAKAAGVDTDVVSELVRKGVVCRSAEGRYLVTENTNS